MTVTADHRAAATALPAAPLLYGNACDEPVGLALAEAFRRMRHAPIDAWSDLLPRVALADVAPFVLFDRDHYTRIPLVSDGWAEAYVMGWLPGQETNVHDHGSSYGVARVLSGVGIEHAFLLEDGRAKLSRGTRIRKGDTLLERPEDVHRVRNDGDDLLVTLHVFAPLLQAFATYEADENP